MICSKTMSRSPVFSFYKTICNSYSIRNKKFTKEKPLHLYIPFLPARRYASTGNSDRNVSVHPSVCLSRAGIVSKRRKLAAWFLHHPVAPKTLVFWHQISLPNSKGFPRTGASNKGRLEKFSDFLALSVNISKTVADTAKVTISD